MNKEVSFYRAHDLVFMVHSVALRLQHLLLSYRRQIRLEFFEPRKWPQEDSNIAL